jgi:D-alanyl-D-alanine dipeptidase
MLKVKPQDFINLKEIIPNIQVELAYATKENFTGNIVDGYDANIAYMTETSAMALKSAQEEFNHYGLGIKVYDSYRPVRAVECFQKWGETPADESIKKIYHPDLTKHDLFRIGYIATRSSHSRGSTLDMTLIELDCEKELDMGSIFDFFGEVSHTAYPKLTPDIRRNRLMLKSTMEKFGFANYHHEWWHFRLEDAPYPDSYFDFVIKEY